MPLWEQMEGILGEAGFLDGRLPLRVAPESCDSARYLWGFGKACVSLMMVLNRPYV